MADMAMNNNGNVTSSGDAGEVLSAKEAELIRELVSTRLETGRQLEYESFDGYELPPRSQFSMLKKPTITIRYGKFACNMAAIRLFEGVQYVLPMVNSDKKRFAIVPCAEEESASVEWTRKRKKDGVVLNRDVVSVDFTEKIFKLMGWNRECRYKVHGRLANSDRGLILVFELDDAIMFEPNREEYTDPVTGKVKKRQVKYYPDFYKDRIGRSYNDYEAARQLNQFEDMGTYEGSEQLEHDVQEAAVDNAATTEEMSVMSDATNPYSIHASNATMTLPAASYAPGFPFQSERNEVMACAK